MLRIQLTASNARALAIAHLDDYRKTKNLADEFSKGGIPATANIEIKEHNWEVIAWMVELLKSPAYGDLREDVEFYRPGPGDKDIKFNVDSVARCVEHDIEIRPQPNE